MGFTPNKTDADMWIDDNGDHYELIAAHVDDIELDGKGLLFLPKDFISN